MHSVPSEVVQHIVYIRAVMVVTAEGWGHRNWGFSIRHVVVARSLRLHVRGEVLYNTKHWVSQYEKSINYVQFSFHPFVSAECARSLGSEGENVITPECHDLPSDVAKV